MGRNGQKTRYLRADETVDIDTALQVLESRLKM